jgi:hypothetical protein
MTPEHQDVPSSPPTSADAPAEAWPKPDLADVEEHIANSDERLERSQAAIAQTREMLKQARQSLDQAAGECGEQP